MENNNEFFRPDRNIGPKEPTTTKKKLAALGLGFFAILVLVLWGINFKNNIFDPLNTRKENNLATSDQCPDGNCLNAENEEILSSTVKDTDNDGISDQDEINIYETSPYLPDSDSDGIDDGTEVKSGTNPNCPQGFDCSVSDSLTSGELSTSSSEVLSENDIIKSNAEILRQTLIETGSFAEEELNGVSDEELLTMYQLIVNEIASSTEE